MRGQVRLSVSVSRAHCQSLKIEVVAKQPHMSRDGQSAEVTRADMVKVHHSPLFLTVLLPLPSLSCSTINSLESLHIWEHGMLCRAALKAFCIPKLSKNHDSMRCVTLRGDNCYALISCCGT